MTHRNLQELIKNLQEFYKCPSCETNYFFEDITFLAEMGTYSFVQLTCHDCSLPMLATVSPGTKPTKARRTDLASGEEPRFALRGGISASEIAEFHRYISRRRSSINPVVSSRSKRNQSS